jgi:DNA end-binding protein Ku
MAKDTEADQDNGDAPRARSFWSGTITFGLVSIPVELYPANRSLGVSLRMVSEDGVPLARRYFCPVEVKELDWDEIVRGYEIEDSVVVVVTDDEVERLAPEKSRDIDLRRFVAANAIDPIYFDRAYYLTPGGNSTKAYRLLAATMEQTERAGIATFVMRGKEYLVAILAENGIMRAETLRFAADVRTPGDVGLPEPTKPRAATVKSMAAEIAKRAKKSLDEGELEDRSAERLLKLVAKKEKAGTDVVEAAEAVEPSGDVIDLMEVLKRSLQGAESGRKPAKKASGAKKTTRKTTKRAAKKSSGTKAKAKKRA